MIPTKGELNIYRFVRPKVRPSHFCPQHISKSVEGYWKKLNTLIEAY